MGWAERNNPNSQWNKKRTMNMTSSVASPITSNPPKQVQTPAMRDEPMVIELTLKNVWGFLCRMLRIKVRPSLVPTN